MRVWCIAVAVCSPDTDVYLNLIEPSVHNVSFPELTPEHSFRDDPAFP